MQKVKSHDGTAIAYYQSGAGVPLVLVHGTSGSAKRWAESSCQPSSKQHFSVYAVDRRGYGESGDSDNYALEHEFEDIAAMVDSVGEPVHLLGHSFGAFCALEAALLTPNLHKLILYEPAIPLPGLPIYPEGVIDRLQALLGAGDREGVLTTLFREVVMMPPHELEALKSSPLWPVRVASAHNAVREARAEEQYEFKAERFENLRIPTLLLQGGDSPPFLKTITEAIAAAFPNSRIAVMPGQQHIAMNTAPELFLHEVLTFLLEPRDKLTASL
jgi:pimeloyl-ACP methyl ester carboxylesterase